jgi:thiol-disulfide isomerase/thioredoxin
MRGKFIGLTVVAAVVAGCALTGGSLSDVRPGRPAPEVEGVDADGRVFRLADYQGRVIMVSFWGNFCPPCRALFRHEKAFVEKFRDKPFVLLGVNGDTEQSELQSAQQSHSLTWRSWWDGGDGAICRRWGVKYFPTVLLIDHTGVIRYRSDGPPDPGVLDARIEQLLGEVPAGAKVG